MKASGVSICDILELLLMNQILNWDLQPRLINFHPKEPFLHVMANKERHSTGCKDIHWVLFATHRFPINNIKGCRGVAS